MRCCSRDPIVKDIMKDGEVVFKCTLHLRHDPYSSLIRRVTRRLRSDKYDEAIRDGDQA